MKYSTHPLLAIGGIALLLSDCGDTTLDYRNAQFSNGKIYNAQDNSPYTGQVSSTLNELFGQSAAGNHCALAWPCSKWQRTNRNSLRRCLMP